MTKTYGQSAAAICGTPAVHSVYTSTTTKETSNSIAAVCIPVVRTIRLLNKAIRKLYNKTAANAMRIQYGGSMNAKNASELMAMPEIDGGLIGGASLKAADFAKVVNY